jgi:4-diphosphocytidyl-2-C-methyl-D-erythritol kinase
MLVLNSPAKINLFLRVLQKRPDGYHEIASLFQTVSLCDRIHFRLSDEDLLTCNDINIPLGPTNLIWKAVDLFRRLTGKITPLNIHLEKKIPIEAGLGGGSGNAATTLWALNQLFGCAEEESTLTHWAAQIGSDIPFFFSHGTAYCTGRGEHVRDLPALPPQKLHLIKPRHGLSTALVYNNLQPVQLEQRNPQSILELFFLGKPVYFNDLESSSFALMPTLASLKQKLLTLQAGPVLMSGSGTAFICMQNPPLIEEEEWRTSCSFLKRQTGSWY